ncbi:uncharacterized protein YndB with AHSA1/START domain [Stackebrandtia albiflava]|uniref:Uncharacterized protein YndB with AHSA1/START domain n=1 Tax=Stackebrandtia albiflava TaxID=406432 RepID=A0A562UY87_9ACTN|nr:SRPBCC family protein [Stackebrandtia albiflava]TWJ10604.1 uncharacterized protein YndB with AHSA1/START domain [Stackebrandtia albiflava]
MYTLTHHARSHAGADRLWRSFTDPNALAAWLWPDPAATAEIALRAGGGWRISAPTLGIGASGVYRSVSAPQRLETTWRWDGESVETEVVVRFSGVGLILTHSGFGSAAERDAHIQGWRDCLARLPDWLDRTPV